MARANEVKKGIVVDPPFATGLTVQVPEYLKIGDKVRIHTTERRYTSRAD
ncbi:hypothetical protein [Oceanisphaera arctica]|nr:hypothetical protein [Oceanisphaera arctica]GHA20431.1 hypothetical protein GCM10007082_21520 [Oceanisphaera arctica]